MAVKTLQFPIVLATNDEEQPQETPSEPQEITRKPQETPTEIHLISDPILEEILSRVPAKTVLRCKSVSKPWLSIVDDPIFARTHFSRAPICPLLVFSDKSGYKSTRIMHLVEGQTVSDLDPRINKSKLTSRIHFSDVVTCSWTRGCFLPVNANVTSCEGVVCWASHDGPGDYIFVCNPVTGEYVTLNSPSSGQDNVYVFIGLGFCRATKKFELLRMSRRRVKNKAEVSPWWPEVLTVGAATCWRRAGDGTSQLDLSRKISEVVYVNGAIYWRYNGDSTICSFHFDRVLFQVITLLQMNLLMLDTNSFASKNMSLGVLANSLCVSLVSPDDGHVELWVMESYSVYQVPWSKLCDVETETTYMEHNGMLGSRGQYKAIKYLDSGEILMHDWRKTFLIYDRITEKERHFCVLEHSSLEDMSTCLHLQVVPHIPCLVKLKDALSMEEERVKVLKAYPGFENKSSRDTFSHKLV
ncbi:hypothetical protein Pfo_013771 [Paulownia fortunei]|nr:hypothetical protein Pfo_013771 [Paulownia fortunei]